MKNEKLTDFAFLVAFTLLVYLLWEIFHHFITPFIFAAIFSGCFYPFNSYLLKRKFPKKWTPMLTTLSILLIIIIPGLYVGLKLSKELYHIYFQVKNMISQSKMEEFLFGEGLIATYAKSLFNFFQIEYSYQSFQKIILNFTQKVSLFLVNFLNNIFQDAFNFLLNFIIMMIFIYILLAEGGKLKKFIFGLMPFRLEHQDKVLNKFNQLNFVTLVGNGIGGIIQGVPVGLLFVFMGIGQPLFWTVLMIFLAFIPLVGISFVTIPFAIYFMASKLYFQATFLMVFSLILSFVVENVFKPRFIGGKLEMNSLLVFISILGGMRAFGMAGIFYGPIIVSVFLTCAEIYQQIYPAKHKR